MEDKWSLWRPRSTKPLKNQHQITKFLPRIFSLISCFDKTFFSSSMTWKQGLWCALKRQPRELLKQPRKLRKTRIMRSKSFLLAQLMDVSMLLDCWMKLMKAWPLNRLNLLKSNFEMKSVSCFGALEPLECQRGSATHTFQPGTLVDGPHVWWKNVQTQSLPLAFSMWEVSLQLPLPVSSTKPISM